MIQSPTIVTTVEAITSIVKSAVTEALAAHKPSAPIESRKLTAKEAADLLGVSIQTIRRWTEAGRLPKQQMGRVVRYELADLNAVLGTIDRS